MGWNSVNFINQNNFNINLNKNRFYFVHSYYAECNNTQDILGETNYLVNFVSAVKKNVYGVQFHPEKVIILVKNFRNIC